MSQTRQQPAALHRSRGPSADSEIQIVVVEDHPPLRQGLELLLAAQGFRMIGSAGCAEQGARMIRARRPDVAVVDIGLGDASGIDLAKTMAHEAPATAIVLYTGSINTVVIDDAVNSGAGALVLKTSPLQHVVDAIRAVAAGRTYVDSAVASMSSGKPGGARRTSKREAQVLGLLASGCTTEQIAGTLFLSPETVQTHVRNATRKLGARGRLHAVILALINGEIDPPDTTR
jgi:DNA-binding NarL/FixJ family response regulator